MAGKVCRECGSENPSDAVYCIKCGAKIEDIHRDNFITQNQLFLRLATIVCIAAILDLMVNSISWGLFNIALYTVFAILGIIGSLLVLYGFFIAPYTKKIRFVYLGSFIASIGFLLVYLLPIMTGRVLFFPVWLILIYIFLMIRKYGLEYVGKEG